MSDLLVETVGLSKAFGPVRAVDDINLTVHAGSIVGLAGPNGAGKTTTIKMLLGMTRPSAGSATVLGHDVVRDSVAVRREAAFIPEDKLLYPDMRVSGFARFYGSFFPEWDEAVLARLLEEWEIPVDRRIKQLSKGMRAKLVLAAALSRRPRVLLMDEPTIDLDPASVEELLSLIAEWTADQDRAVLLATHRLEEVERICDHVTVMVEGRQALSGVLDELKLRWKSLRVLGGPAVDEIRGWDGVRRVSASGDLKTVIVDADPARIRGRLESGGAAGVEVHDMNLREIYLTLTNYERGRLDGAVESLV